MDRECVSTMEIQDKLLGFGVSDPVGFGSVLEDLALRLHAPSFADCFVVLVCCWEEKAVSSISSGFSYKELRMSLRLGIKRLTVAASRSSSW